MRQFLLLLLVSLGLLGSVEAKVVTKEVSYEANGVTLKGYLAYDDATQTKRPGILVVHEWWGHDKYARKRARMLAKLGYTAFALDMYGNGKQASHPKDAGKFSGEVKKNLPMAKARFSAAMKVLKEHPATDDEQIGAIGYCFGGAVVLEMARLGMDLKGVASFHGSLGTAHPAQKGKVKARVLVLNGAADPFVKPAQIDAIANEMKAAGVNYQFINYPGAKHSFTNPGADAYGKKFKIPLAYHKDADQKSWQAMQKMFKAVFK